MIDVASEFNPIPTDLLEYSEWGKTHDHVVQISFPRSGRVWIADMITFLRGNDITLKMPLDNKDYNQSCLSEEMLYTTHLYERFPLFNIIKYILLVRDPRAATSSRKMWTERHIRKDYFNRDILDQWIQEWRYYIELFSSKNTLIVQYEKMCLHPEQELDRIMEFAAFDKLNTMDNLRRLEVLSIESGSERYQKYCLKWQVNADINKVIWEELGDMMLGFGYTQYGHALNLFM